MSYPEARTVRVLSDAEWKKKEEMEKILENKSTNAHAWFNLATLEGGTVGGRVYTVKECYQKGLAKKPTDGLAWYKLVTLGGGVVSGLTYSKKDCCLKALENNPTLAGAWYHLSDLDGGEVGGRKYSKKECCLKALEYESTDRRTVRSVDQMMCGTRRECLATCDCLDLRGSSGGWCRGRPRVFSQRVRPERAREQ